ncbi:class I SAM-dependent methyltransferase [Ningiella sp. W23]|uniref:class I SAM-dependent methyltransferase n=1 Tax=Ningiella sp. W23 TaxID=3023715 RepID=UPI0037572224
MNNTFQKRTACMSCSQNRVVEFIDLGIQPSGNAFISPNESIEKEPQFPLRMGVCKNCWQVQLLDHIDKNLLFDDHPYLTGTNQPMVEHFHTLSVKLANDYSLTRSDLVLDIGCNDGTFLNQFDSQGMSTIGVEPSTRISEMAREQGHVVINKFWNSDTAASFNQLNVKPKLITAMSVFYHVSNLHDFLDGIELVMSSRSVFVIQAVSLLSLLSKNQFDHFYHEHTCIHSLSSLNNILKKHNLKVIDIEDVDVHGGSFIASLALNNSDYEISEKVTKYAQKELDEGLKDIGTYMSFGQRAKDIASHLKQLLIELNAQDEVIFGLGAPLKSSTFLNFADIDSSLIACLTEVNELKIGKLSPGKHIPVVDEKAIDKEPDYYVVFAWNYLEYLMMKKKAFLNAGGKFIVPFPNLRIVSRDDF